MDNGFYVGLFYLTVLILLVWYFAGARIIANIKQIKNHNIRVLNTIEIINRFYNNEKIDEHELYNTFLDKDGRYKDIWWSIKQRKLLTHKCEKCRNKHYLKNDFEFINNEIDLQMLSGRITKKGVIDERFNTEFKINEIYHYSAKCPKCKAEYKFSTNEELYKYNKRKKIEFIDDEQEEITEMKNYNRIQFLKLSLISISLLSIFIYYNLYYK